MTASIYIIQAMHGLVYGMLLFLVASGLFYLLRNTLGFSLGGIILTGAGLSLAGMMVFVWVLPESILRLVLWVVILLGIYLVAYYY